MVTYVVILAVLIVAAQVVLSRWAEAAKPWEQLRRQRVVFWLDLPLFLVLFGWGVANIFSGQKLYGFLMAFVGVSLTICNAIMAFRSRTRVEAASYMLDTRHCGRCGYDLTGNVSGVCPECGWTLVFGHHPPAPDSPDVPTTDPHWHAFWKHWRIQRMDDWRTRLTAMKRSAVFRSAMFVVQCWIICPVLPGMIDLSSPFSGQMSFLLLLVLLPLVFLLLAAIAWIQVIRIAAYGHRQRNEKDEKCLNL